MKFLTFTFSFIFSLCIYAQKKTDSLIRASDKTDSISWEVDTNFKKQILQQAANDSLQRVIGIRDGENKKLKEELAKTKEKSDQAEIRFKLFFILLLVSIILFTVYYFMKKRTKLKKLKNIVSDLPKPIKQSFKTEAIAMNDAPNRWFVVSASVIGKSHIAQSLPCQDESSYTPLLNDWGIAVVCDGAGSAKNSALGAKYTVKVVSKLFGDLVERKGWMKQTELPSESDWSHLAKEELKMALSGLNKHGSESGWELASLACTVIIIIYSPNGLLVTHIGDGRAGYCDEKGDWHSAITPHKGEEANQTIFLTSYAWVKDEKLVMSGVKVPESRVIKQKITAFTLMSDGCEQHSFECSIFDSVSQQWSDPNLPYPKFFNPLASQIKSLATQKDSDIEVNNNWKKFLESGNEGLKNEPDDKTLILGVLV